MTKKQKQDFWKDAKDRIDAQMDSSKRKRDLKGDLSKNTEGKEIEVANSVDGQTPKNAIGSGAVK